MFILRLTRQPALDFDRRHAIGENRNPVEAFLPVPDGVITNLLELCRRETLILRLDFLQAGNRRPGFLKPFKQTRQARLDAVYVKSRDFHFCMVRRSKGCTLRGTGPLPSEEKENVWGTFSPKGPATHNDSNLWVAGWGSGPVPLEPSGEQIIQRSWNRNRNRKPPAGSQP